MIEITEAVSALIERNALIVVLTAQRSVALQLAFSASRLRLGQTSWRTPRIATWRSWLESRARQSRSRVLFLPELEEWLVWRDAARRAWRADLQLLDTPSDALIETLRRSAVALFEWSIPERALIGTPEAEWLDRTIEYCDEVCASRAATPRYRLPALPVDSAGAETGFVVGFGDYTPAQQSLLASGALEAVEPFKDDHSGCDHCVHRAALPRGVAADNPAEEIALAADWARERLEANPSARLLILVPDLRQREHEILRRFKQSLQPRRYIHANDSASPVVAVEGGRELNQFEVVMTRLAMIRPPQGSVPVLDMLGWLRAVLGDLGSAAEAARLDAWLRSMLEPDTSIEALVPLLAKAPAALTSLATRLRSRLESMRMGASNAVWPMSRWTSEFRRVWQAIEPKAHSTAVDSEEQQTIARFASLLDELEQSVAPARQFDAHAAASCVESTAARTRFEPASGDVPVTLSSALSDPVVCYDGIWVSGLDADSWPPAPRLDAFIPAAAQRTAGMTQSSASRLARDAEARMRSWVRSSKVLTLSWSRIKDGAQQRPSPLVERLVGLIDTGGAERVLSRLSLAEIQHRPHQLEPFDDARGTPLSDGRRIPKGALALQLQAQCAFHAYAELRLHAPRFDIRAAGIDPRDRGRLMHKALEFLWQAFGSGAGLQAARGSFEAHIEHAISRAELALEAELGWANVSHDAHRHRMRERERLAALLKLLCERDALRPEFLDVQCEKEVSFELAGAGIRLRIDRIDRLANGHVAVFDYKSGKPRNLSLMEDRLVEPQLPLYALATGETVDAMATVHLTAAAVTLKGLARESGSIGGVDVVENWEAQLLRWRDQLESLAFAFLSGDALRDPADDACRYCHLQVVCRISKTGDDPEAPLR